MLVVDTGSWYWNMMLNLEGKVERLVKEDLSFTGDEWVPLT